jgi:hypothetical protein
VAAPPTTISVHLVATHVQVIVCMQGTMQLIIGGRGAVVGRHAPQQVPTYSG